MRFAQRRAQVREWSVQPPCPWFALPEWFVCRLTAATEKAWKGQFRPEKANWFVRRLQKGQFINALFMYKATCKVTDDFPLYAQSKPDHSKLYKDRGRDRLSRQPHARPGWGGSMVTANTVFVFDVEGLNTAGDAHIRCTYSAQQPSRPSKHVPSSRDWISWLGGRGRQVCRLYKGNTCAVGRIGSISMG
jgi:hypothetical protein